MQQLCRRLVGVFCSLVLLMTVLIYQVYNVGTSDVLAASAQGQGKYRMRVATTRGMIYDRNGKGLVNNESKYVASVLPTPEAAAALLGEADEETRGALVERLTDARPFVMEVEDGTLYAQGIDVFRVAERYGATRYAPHLIGYLGDGGIGVAGLERAYEDVLSTAGGEIGVLYQVDAVGRMMDDMAASVERTNEEPVGGIVLTLDRDLQEIAQEALEKGCDKGAAVVMDVENGDILAMASIPAFDQNDVAASLERSDAPFVNRATSGFNIGSVFKLLVAAGALENGQSRYFQHECEGYIDVNGQIFKCNNDAVHGLVDMSRALEVSCNAYFIRLAQEVDPERLLTIVGNMGLNQAVELVPGVYTEAGNLPALEELSIPAGYANFSFGQGSSLASPLQIAQSVAVLANGGKAVTPRLVLGITDNGADLIDPTPVYATNRVISRQTSETLQELMINVIEQGSGRPARPVSGGAGGKTSSAQTGQYVQVGEEEKEIVHAWFAGFTPAKDPKYAIVVFVEGGESGERVAGPIFKQIADGITRVLK